MLKQTEKLQAIQQRKGKRPEPLKLDAAQYLMEESYLPGQPHTNKYAVMSPLEMANAAATETDMRHAY